MADKEVPSIDTITVVNNPKVLYYSKNDGEVALSEVSITITIMVQYDLNHLSKSVAKTDIEHIVEYEVDDYFDNSLVLNLNQVSEFIKDLSLARSIEDSVKANFYYTSEHVSEKYKKPPNELVDSLIVRCDYPLKPTKLYVFDGNVEDDISQHFHKVLLERVLDDNIGSKLVVRVKYQY